jgi:elongation factor Ts
MAISASDVKRLREQTGVGMMDCKKALQEANGDFDAAIDFLRKKGQKVAAKRADRDATEGQIIARSADGDKTAALVEVNSETDFVARNDDFQNFAGRLADLVIENRPADLAAFKALDFEGGRTVEEALTDMTGKIGEKIDVRRFAILTSENGRIISYIHPGAQLGVLVDATGDNAPDAARDVAMQIAALNPVAATRDEVPQEVKDKELEIGRELALAEGKPEQIVDKIATGKLDRYYKDNVLVEQPFVKDSSKTVKQMLSEQGVEVSRFVRFALGG